VPEDEVGGRLRPIAGGRRQVPERGSTTSVFETGESHSNSEGYGGKVIHLAEHHAESGLKTWKHVFSPCDSEEERAGHLHAVSQFQGEGHASSPFERAVGCMTRILG